MGRVDIVPDGDVILVVQDQVELRVYSIVLKLASAVFKAMLGPHFAEGQVQGTPTDPKSVSLQEDSTEGMKMLCLCLHHPQATATSCTHRRPGYRRRQIRVHECCSLRSRILDFSDQHPPLP